MYPFTKTFFIEVSMSVNKGAILNVRDLKDDNHYKCKVVQVKEGQIKIHYIGWSKNPDQWLSLE